MERVQLRMGRPHRPVWGGRWARPGETAKFRLLRRLCTWPNRAAADRPYAERRMMTTGLGAKDGTSFKTINQEKPQQRPTHLH